MPRVGATATCCAVRPLVWWWGPCLYPRAIQSRRRPIDLCFHIGVYRRFGWPCGLSRKHCRWLRVDLRHLGDHCGLVVIRLRNRLLGELVTQFGECVFCRLVGPFWIYEPSFLLEILCNLLDGFVCWTDGRGLDETLQFLIVLAAFSDRKLERSYVRVCLLRSAYSLRSARAGSASGCKVDDRRRCWCVGRLLHLPLGKRARWFCWTVGHIGGVSTRWLSVAAWGPNTRGRVGPYGPGLGVTVCGDYLDNAPDHLHELFAVIAFVAGR